MVLPPSPRQQPAAVGDGATGLAGLPRASALQQRHQGLTAARRMTIEVIAPRIDLRARDGRPRLPVPGAEIDFDQTCVDAMPPPPTFQPGAHRGAAPQRRRDHDARQALAARESANAVRQALRAARVDGKISARADATPFGLLRTRMAPRVHDIRGHGQAGNNFAVSASSTASSVNCSVAPSVSPV